MPLASGLVNNMLNWAFTTTSSFSPARPAAWYASLHTGNPGGTGANELTSGTATGYVRQSTTLGAASGQQISNSGAVSFTAGGTWPSVSYAGLWDASSAGNFLAGMQLVQQGTSYGLAAAGIVAGGSGYVAGDVGKQPAVGSTSATVTITAVSGGAVTGVQVGAAGSVAAGSLPTEPVSTSGGGTTGSGLTLDTFWQQSTTSYTLNNNDSLSFAAGQLVFSMNFLPVITPN